MTAYKNGVCRQHADISTCVGQAYVGYSKFCDLWNQLCPFIVIMCPATDLCWTYQENNNCIQKSKNLPQVEKAEAVRAQQHLLRPMGERTLYQRLCTNQRKTFSTTSKMVTFWLDLTPALMMGQCITPMTRHHSCITPLIQINLGLLLQNSVKMYTKAIPCQVNFLMEENVLTGKGANGTISYVPQPKCMQTIAVHRTH